MVTRLNIIELYEHVYIAILREETLKLSIVSHELAFFNLVLTTIYSIICSLFIHYL